MKMSLHFQRPPYHSLQHRHSCNVCLFRRELRGCRPWFYLLPFLLLHRSEAGIMPILERKKQARSDKTCLKSVLAGGRASVLSRVCLNPKPVFLSTLYLLLQPNKCISLFLFKKKIIIENFRQSTRGQFCPFKLLPTPNLKYLEKNPKYPMISSINISVYI